MTVGERIKYVRSKITDPAGKRITLERFGAKIGLTKSALSMIENDKSSLTDQTALAISREYGVSLEWLRTGSGEPFPPKSHEEEIAEFFKTAQTATQGSIMTRLLSIMARLDESDWETLAKIAQMIVDEGDLTK